MTSKFEVYEDKAGEYRFRLVAPNGQTILASQGYNQKASALNGIESVKKNAPIARIFEIEAEGEVVTEISTKEMAGGSIKETVKDVSVETGTMGAKASGMAAAAGAGAVGVAAGLKRESGMMEHAHEDHGIGAMDKIWGLIGILITLLVVFVVAKIMFF